MRKEHLKLRLDTSFVIIYESNSPFSGSMCDDVDQQQVWYNSEALLSSVSSTGTDCLVRVSSKNITHLGRPKSGHKPRQLLSLPPFPPHPPPGKNGPPDSRMTSISWMKYYFADVTASLIQSHFNKGLVRLCSASSQQATKGAIKGWGNVAVHNSMDALAAAALCYDYDEGPKLACSDRCEPTTYQRYWALVIGTPKEKQGLISAPLTKVVLNGGKAERVMLGYGSGGVEEAVTEYRVLGPTINGCSWVELRPLTNHKHQMRVHCAEALGTPIVGDYKYGWFMHSRWKQMPTPDYEPTSGEPFKLRRPDGLDVKKGSVLSKVPLLHLHSRELVIPNVAKHLQGPNKHVYQHTCAMNYWNANFMDLIWIARQFLKEMMRQPSLKRRRKMKTVEGVLDFDTIDVEVDDDLIKKQSRRCTDEFLNSLCLEDGEEEFVIPEHDEAPVEEEPMEEEQVNEEDGDEGEEGGNESEAEFQYSTHDPNVKWNKTMPQEGERYASPQQLKECLTNYAIAQGYQLRFLKCATVRIHCVCASDPAKYSCPYFVKASWMSTEMSCQIKKIYPKHTCVKNFNKGKVMGPTWLARQFLKELIRQP
ncbi:hypothetical protein LXL04_039376 [Taraxacum kok-saghyz]